MRGRQILRCLLCVLASVATLTAAPLRVVSYNIHHGVGMDGKLDLDRIATVLKKLNADVIALQEVDKGCERSGNVDQTTYLADKLGMHAVFGKAINLGSGEYGNAILSRHALVSKKIHRLPSVGEQRIALEVKIQQTDETAITVISTHLHDGEEAVRLQQGKALFNLFKDHKEGILCLLGDFNAQRESESMKFWQSVAKVVPKQGEANTWPADKPQHELDYCVFLSAQAVMQVVGEVIAEAVASDHRPILTEISQ